MPVHPKRGAAGGVAGIAMALMLLTAGCVGPVEVAPSPTASQPAPVFASDEEALAAAEKAYAAYLAMSDLIAQEGGIDPERIAPYVTAEQLEVEMEGYRLFVANGWRTIGRSAYSTPELQMWDESTLVIYVCSDSSNVDLVDAADVLVRSNSAVPDLLLEVGFALRMKTLLIDRVEPLDDESRCAR